MRSLRVALGSWWASCVSPQTLWSHPCRTWCLWPTTALITSTDVFHSNKGIMLWHNLLILLLLYHFLPLSLFPLSFLLYVFFILNSLLYLQVSTPWSVSPIIFLSPPFTAQPPISLSHICRNGVFLILSLSVFSSSQTSQILLSWKWDRCSSSWAIQRGYSDCWSCSY